MFRNIVDGPYYGAAFLSEAIGVDGHSVAMLDNGTDFMAVYGIYSSTGKPLRLLLINTDFFDGTGTRPSTTISLTGLETESSTLRAKRLTAPSAVSIVSPDELSPITLAGQTFNAMCSRIGREAVESIKVVNGSVAVALQASESLLVWLH